MRETLKSLWIWAGKAANTMMSVSAAMLFSSRRVARRLRDIAKGIDTTRKAFVLGCGPSLKEGLATPCLLQELQNSDVMVTNRFAISNDFKTIRPRYYILLDPLFYDEDFIKSDPSVKNMYESMNRVDWSMTLFLPKGANIELIKQYLSNLNVSIELFNGTTIIGPVRFQNRMYRRGLGLPSSRNVIIPGLILMINFGYKNIYLYGSEFSWTKNFDVDPSNNRVFENSRHFYNEKKEYFKKGEYHEYLKRIDEMLFGTEQIAFFAESRGACIVNRTKGSFIDAFEYQNPDTICK